MGATFPRFCAAAAVELARWFRTLNTPICALVAALLRPVRALNQLCLRIFVRYSCACTIVAVRVQLSYYNKHHTHVFVSRSKNVAFYWYCWPTQRWKIHPI